MVTWIVAGVGSVALVTTSIPAEAAAAKPAAHKNAEGERITSSAPPVAATAKSLPNYQAIGALIDKIFPPQLDPDPARLARARMCVASLWPDGAYANMMSNFIGNLMTGVMQVRKSDLASLGSRSPNQAVKAGTADSTIHDQAAAKDPYFDQRMAATLAVVHEEIAKLSVVIDPRMREGLARSMARHLDERQLTDINAFLATPSGHAFAGQYLQLWFEPDTMRAMFGAIPDMAKLMPDLMQKLKAVNEKFPKPKTPAADRTKH